MTLKFKGKYTCNCQGSWKAKPCRVYWLLLHDQALTREIPLVLCKTTYQPTNKQMRNVKYTSMRVPCDPDTFSYQFYKLTIFGSFLCNSSRALSKEPLSSSKETWKEKNQAEIFCSYRFQNCANAKCRLLKQRSFRGKE